MANLRNELKSRHASLRRLYDDLKGSSFARAGWNTEVRARRTPVPTKLSSTGSSPNIF